MKGETREKIKYSERLSSSKVHAGHDLDAGEAYPEATYHECNGSGVDSKKAFEYIKCLESEITQLKAIDWIFKASGEELGELTEDKDFEP